MARLPTMRETALLAELVICERYGRELKTEFERRTGKTLPLGSLYVTLDRMERRGYVQSREGEETHKRGGNRRKYYRITLTGNRALAAAARVFHGLVPCLI